MKRIPHRKAFTLLELLIVLSLIVAILGLGFPAVHRMYLRSQLKGAAQELQSRLYRTRLESMKTGKAYVFRYQFDSGLFEILPKEVFDQNEKDQVGLGAAAIGPELQESSDSQTESSFEVTSMPEIPAVTPEIFSVYRQTLPNRIQFISLSPLAEGAGKWSTPILFYPNGRTGQALLVLKSPGPTSMYQKLSLRGLTGTASLLDK